jgi:hypothetical protein
MTCPDPDPRKALARALRPLILVVAAGALAGCAATGTSGGLQATAAAKPPMTHTQAAEECWMGTEKTDAHMPLDQRADIVDRCIAEKMGTAPPPPKSAAAGGKKKKKTASIEPEKKKPARISAESKKKKPAHAGAETKKKKASAAADAKPQAQEKKPEP